MARPKTIPSSKPYTLKRRNKMSTVPRKPGYLPSVGSTGELARKAEATDTMLEGGRPSNHLRK